ncbi:Pyridoxamine 5'-phosphate oxidase [Streptomyces mirabilis]|jgi:nitroimidazol reductase NimA-like FMN-containing flavoprotein (pyridoxamine 5'-phosphate oxidase superfamily)|uniref:Pyridoxamine 5'-phosphate oxidase n=1 Tax=Streptomyces mirabilis TaxID=68239 RepID=A0A1I1Z5X6_9ACTN|nr:Pyridoxamine 5'-phosphate oxidase [Streptomyces mirabilis]
MIESLQAMPIALSPGWAVSRRHQAVSDEPVRRLPTTAEGVRPTAGGPQGLRTVELDGAQALRLLGSVSLGRIAFTQHALPTIRPVNHIVDDGVIVIRTHEGAAMTSRTLEADGSGVVVAYEADDIDPDTHLGWSVVVTGYAHLVTDTGELARYQELLRPRVRQTMDYAVRILPDLVTGLLLAPVDRPAGA